MSTFLETLDDYLGEADDGNSDIRVTVVPCFEYAFDNGTIRFWRGQGRLITNDGRVWLGSVDANGTDHHMTPGIKDGRDGTSARMEFGLPYLDKATFDAIKAEHEPVAGRLLTVYLALIEMGEGLRPAGDLEFLTQLTMQSPTFSDSFGWVGGELRRQYKVTVIAKDGNAGRSKASRGTYSDTCQQERAAALGVPIDYGCGFVLSLADTTLTFP